MSWGQAALQQNETALSWNWPTYNVNMTATLPRKQSDDAKRQHLKLSSRHLLTACPAVSARLQREMSKIETRSSSDEAEMNSMSCSSCGQNLIPGLTCEQVRPVKKTKRSSAQAEMRLVSVKCSLCSRNVTIQRRRETKPASIRTTNAPSSNAAGQETTKAVTSAITTVSGEQRKASGRRQRGKASSLQALLDKSQSNQPSAKSGFGFDISDLLKR